MRGWAFTVGAIAALATATWLSCGAAAAGPDPGVAAEGFLVDLDRGAFSTAYKKLDPLAQRNYDYGTFVTAARSLQGGGKAASTRKRTYVGPADRFGVQAQQSFRRYDTQAKYVVACFREQPVSGWGRLTYVEVMMTGAATGDFRVTDFTSRSEPGPNCPK